jgi:hypothetical protein
MTTIRALVFVPGKNAEVRDIQPDLQILQQLIGGYPESIPLDPRSSMVIDQDGAMKSGSRTNTGATLFLTRYGRAGIIVGTAVVIGIKPGGDTADCPADLIALYPGLA